MVTPALATDAPDGSVTFPRIVLWMACPFISTAESSKRTETNNPKQHFERLFIIFLVFLHNWNDPDPRNATSAEPATVRHMSLCQLLR